MKMSPVSLVIPDVYIKKESSILDLFEVNFNLTGISSWNLFMWTLFSGSATSAIFDKPKTDLKALQSFHDLFNVHIINKKELLPDGYKFFGSNNSIENLYFFLKSNPLFASALIASRNPMGQVQYEINSRSILPARHSSDSNWFKRLINTLDDSYLRVDAKFDQNFKLVEIKSYKATKGKKDISIEYEGLKNKDKVEEACTALLFLLTFYSEVIHGQIHCFHYLMTAGVSGATSHSQAISAWTAPFAHNVAAKYHEVKTLHFGEMGTVCGGVYRSDRTQVLEIVREMMCKWGSLKTADQFVNEFLLADVFDNVKREAILETGIVEQFLKHAALIHPFATEIVGEFEKTQQGCTTQCNEELKRFLADTSDSGDVSSVSTLNTWIELMSVTGMLHGCTLSVTRLICTPAIIGQINRDEQLYISADIAALNTFSNALVGMTEERHVFSNTVQSSSMFYSFPPGIGKCLSKFSSLSADLKSAYLSQLKSRPKEFLSHGWILTDYCPDGVDGKQLSLTSYF